MTIAHGDLRARIERLAPDARALLMDRLGLAADERRAPTQQLVAWIVPARGQEDASELAAFLRERLPEHMVPSAFVFLDMLPRLPNGKADTEALPAPVPSAAAEATFVRPRSSREQTLASIWSDVLGVDRIGVHDNFFELGGDSILSIQVVARARRAGLHITADLVFRHQTLGALAAAANEAPAAVRDEALTSAPLSPVQAWFFEQPLDSPHHWHQAVWLRPPAYFDAARFERAVRHLVAHHEALRLSFRREASGWRQYVSGEADVHVHEIAMAQDDPDITETLQRAVDELCATTDLTSGPLVLPALVRRPDGGVDRILLAVHHLAIDAVSWSILLEDLRASYEADTGSPALMRSTTFLSWCNALRRIADGPAMERDVAYWRSPTRDARPLPREHDGDFDEASAFEVVGSLDADVTARLVYDVHAAYNTTVEDFLVAALARTIGGWTGCERVLLGLERHGRESLVPGADLSRTVGWLTAYFPVVLDAPAGEDAGAALRATKEALRAIPQRGAGYGVLRYLRSDGIALELAAVPEPEVIFNHAGRIDAGSGVNAGWTMLAPPFASRAPSNRRAHRIEVNTFIAAGALYVHWTAGSAQYERATVERLAARFLDELRALCGHAISARTSGFTPADFPEAGLDQAELDRFLGGLGA